jgi:hypothetical protein
MSPVANPQIPLAQQMRMLAARRSQGLQAPGAQLVPAAQRGIAPDPGYWYGYVPAPERRRMTVNMDRPAYRMGSGEETPPSDDPREPIVLNTNCPPWVCPPYWSIPLDLPTEVCVPWYQVSTQMPCFKVPQGYYWAVKGLSYEALNAAQDDVFEFEVTVDGQQVLLFEDVVADAAQPNPAQKFGLAGHFRELPCHFIADFNTTVCARATLRGAVTLAGNSPNWPGQPIATGNCQMLLVFHGWLAPNRQNVEGGPRATDLGDFGNLNLMDDQAGWEGTQA